VSGPIQRLLIGVGLISVAAAAGAGLGGDNMINDA